MRNTKKTHSKKFKAVVETTAVTFKIQRTL